MVLKMTHSFTRSMAVGHASNKCPAEESPTETLKTTSTPNQRRDDRGESTASSSFDSSSTYEEVGLADVHLQEEKEEEEPVSMVIPPSEPKPRTSAADGVAHGLIEISLVREEDSGPSQSDLDAIDDLIECAKEGDLPLFQRLCEALARRHIGPDCAGYMGWTPAHWAARHGHVHLLEFLLQQGVNLDLLDKKGDSLLHKAAANGQFRVCQWLLQHGFNVQCRNNNGHTPLDIAQQLLALSKSNEAALCESILARENAHTF